MNDQQMDRLIERLDVAANPNPEWVNTSLAQLLPNARQARQRDASPLGQAERVLAALRRLLWESGSRRTLMSIAIGVLLTTMLGIYLVGTSNREPPGGPTGLLVVVQNAGLEAIDIRDTSTIELIPPASQVSAVSRSVDGRLVAFRVFVFRGDVQPNIVYHYEVMGTDGAGRRRVATELTFSRPPTGLGDPGLGEPCHDVWSPDSRFVVTGVDVIGGSKRIVVIDIASGEPRFVTPETTQAGCPIWSPDGAWIAYTTSDGVLERARPDGTGAKSLSTYTGGATSGDSTVPPTQATSWSDDGWIYWAPFEGGVYRTHFDTRETETVSDTRFGIGFAPALSPDGTQLALMYDIEGERTSDLYLSAPDGSDARRLVSNVLIFDGWSVDGQYLLFVWAPPPESGETGGLVALKPDGSERRLLRPVNDACQVADDSCFRDIGWGQSRP
jgi:WD40-like Beta Propeller Repeat